MRNQAVLARCNMFGVLKNIEYLVEHNKECADLVKGVNLAIQFNVKNGPKANLAFKDGKAEMKVGKHKCNMKLLFTSVEHFNKMIDGKANPIPVKGFTKIGFLTGTFTKLADFLGMYLRASEESLKDPTFFRMNTEMTAYAAMFALSEIGNYDEVGSACALHIPDGKIQVLIKDGIGIVITVKNGLMMTEKGFTEDPFSILCFSSLESAHGVLSGKLDTYTAIALGEMEMRGFIPQVEHMNPILALVSGYLA